MKAFHWTQWGFFTWGWEKDNVVFSVRIIQKTIIVLFFGYWLRISCDTGNMGEWKKRKISIEKILCSFGGGLKSNI